MTFGSANCEVSIGFRQYGPSETTVAYNGSVISDAFSPRITHEDISVYFEINSYNKMNLYAYVDGVNKTNGTPTADIADICLIISPVTHIIGNSGITIGDIIISEVDAVGS